MKRLLLSLAVASVALVDANNHQHNHAQRHHNIIEARKAALAQPANLPESWSYKGCYTDSVAHRTLGGGGYGDAQAMTGAACVDFCVSKGEKYAGTEWAQECFCGNSVWKDAVLTPDVDCNLGCKGAPQEACGGNNRISIYESSENVSPSSSGPSTLATVPSNANNGKARWVSRGCWTDNVQGGGGRALPTFVNVDGDGKVTNEKCAQKCESLNFKYAGSEYSAECYCSNEIQHYSAPVTLGDCSMTCAGNAKEWCGGPDRLNVYQFDYDGTLTPVSETSPATPYEVAKVKTTGGEWVSRGCYSDNADGQGRTLSQGVNVEGGMTIEKCAQACANAKRRFCSTEYAGECYCGNTIDHGGAQTPADDCNMACSGNSFQRCGGGFRMNLYEYTGTYVEQPKPSIVPAVGNWKSTGCYSDQVNGGGRTLAQPAQCQGGDCTIQRCTAACKALKLPLAGTEYGAECWCGSEIANGGAATPAAECNMVCAGNSAQFCGGPNRLNTYHYDGDINDGAPDPEPGPEPAPEPVPEPGNGNGNGGNGENNNNGGDAGSNANGPQPAPQEDLPQGWKYEGCWVDGANGRIFETELGYRGDNTVQSCIKDCTAREYTVAGMEYAACGECYCGKRLINGATKGEENTCGMGCAGNTKEACGGPNRLSVYSSEQKLQVLPVPITKKTNLPGDWQYLGCYSEADNYERLFPWFNTSTTNTPDACLAQCSKYGYMLSGLEYGEECYCGTKDIVGTRGSTELDENQCDFACSGDPIHHCGGPRTLTIYSYEGPLTQFKKLPTIGRYEFLVPGIVVPLIATVGKNNKVTFLEKDGTGFANSSGAYELDLSLINGPGGWEKAWRAMSIKTDVFCAASIILPDKGARQLNVGGWSGESTYGLRLFTPDGSPGKASVNDWEENPATFQLQRGRWYPTAATLSNGSILVIGGQTGSNAPPEPTLEILPTPEGGPTYLEMDWLRRTDPNNLYPYVVVLPSHHLFIAYYNEARILDEKTFETIKILPDIPGAVFNSKAGRTYPLEGASVCFPQHYPYTDPLRVLICGGSPGVATRALDNCVSLTPEVEGAQWDIELMPSPRVLPNMAYLANGQLMIFGGAKNGVAGFGLAYEPNNEAVLYDFDLPLNSRMSRMGTTIVDRMYHSEATLLPDGRVMISGSDPQDPRYNEEFRIEVYVPPYLANGQEQPKFTISKTDWAYGETVPFELTSMPGGGTPVVTLIFSTSSTHGNTMQARCIFPLVECVTAKSCVVTAPPDTVSPPGWHMMYVMDGAGTPSYAEWVRIGGDPGKLGDWPKLDGFSRPGS